jgi:hypothetical protein
MRELKRIIMAVLIGAMVTLGAVGGLAQKGNTNNNRPPKETPKVVDREKPPPKNGNSNRGKPE